MSKTATIRQRLDQMQEVRRMEKELSGEKGMPKESLGTNITSDIVDPRLLSLPLDSPDGLVPDESKPYQNVSYGRKKSTDNLLPDEKTPLQNVSYGREKSVSNVVPDENKPFQNVSYGRQHATDPPSWKGQEAQANLFQNVTYGQQKAATEQLRPAFPAQQSALFQNVAPKKDAVGDEYTTYKPKSILPSRRQEKVVA